jgi:alcohol dehydrogenase (cytochrome c)
MRANKLLLVGFAALWSVAVPAQGLDPASILKPLGENWPTYSGDYTGMRHSRLTQINQANVKNLTLAWSARMAGGAGNSGGVRTTVGGEGADTGAGGPGANVNIRASILEVEGVLYFSAPDNAWAVDARTGRTLWHYFWKTKGGTHIGNRGLGMWRQWLYMETPDDYLVCLDSKTGKEKWHVEIASFNLQYFSTMAPIVVGDHVLVGTGDDLDEPGFLQSRDPETGALQWKWYAVPMKKGDAGMETWGDVESASHGGGNIWIPGSYDPETHLYIFGTGNPSPAYNSPPGRKGDNLYTCSIVAVNVDTGKLAWHFQTSPHDMHDEDSTETPILVNGEFNGNQRKMVLHASRNGYYFTLDRLTGERLLTSKYSPTVNWAKGLDDKGRPARDEAKDATVPGSINSPNSSGATNWPPPAFNPDTGLFYVPTNDVYSIYYLTETDPRGAMGLGGIQEDTLASIGGYLTAIDYKTGKVVWKHRYPGTGGNLGNGILSTAGKLLFAGDLSGNLVSYDAATGKILWHTRLQQISNAPETYLLDGHQYVLVAAGDQLYAFTLY